METLVERSRWWIRYSLTLLALVALHLAYGGYFASIPEIGAPTPSPTPQEAPWLGRLLSGQAAGQGAPEFLQQKGLAWVSAYDKGSLVFHRSDFTHRRGPNLEKWLRQVDQTGVEAIEVGVSTEVANLGNSDPPMQEQGLWGLILSCPSGPLCLSPNEFARRGSSLYATFQSYQRDRGVLRARRYRALTWVLCKEREFQATPQLRGESLIRLTDVDYRQIQEAAESLGKFQIRQAEQGYDLLPYTYLVLEAKGSDQDRVLVRNCLGSWSLASYAGYSGNEKDAALCTRNLQTMVARYGRYQSGNAYITDTGYCFLGAQALFGMALLTHSQLTPELQNFERRLAQGVLATLQPDGHFSTSVMLAGFAPRSEPDPEKDANQDFFPGEALTYLACKAQREPKGPWLKAFDQAYPYYQARFRRRPAVAAVPWLVRASVERFRVDGNQVAKDFAFECADWHLANLQPYEQMDPFLRGSPINPENRRYGSYVATSAAGVQLEGMVKAFQLAAKIGDVPHQQRYRQTILELSRYLMQVQYRQAWELYWMAPELRQGALGGLRDLPWSHRIQVDSTAHALNAWVELLQTTKPESLTAPKS